jgi:hypothetical protein
MDGQLADSSNRISRQARSSRRINKETQEIGEAPITSAQRRKGTRLRRICAESLESFNVLVFPNSTGLKPLGPVQKNSIAHDEAVIVAGGRVCKAEPRGFGKTTRTCNAGLWGILYGLRQMVPVFSANMEKSKTQIMGRWKAEILGNDLLFWMFPELIWPLRALENKNQRCESQTYKGEPTRTKWTSDRIVFPHIPGVTGSGAVLIALPLKSCRGATHTMPQGTVLRPDLCIFDDVQKDEDADNPNTVAKIEDLIDHTAMMLGGHSQSMSAIMNCTVRRLDDLSEQYLKKPGWRRVRYKLLTSPAKAEKDFWFGEYSQVRNDYDPESPDDQLRAQKASKKLYASKQKMADDGAATTWDWAYSWADDDPTEISAIQHAYNIQIDLGDSVFASECQNEPLKQSGGLEILTVDQICAKQSAFERGGFPIECSALSLFVDVHPEILYWNVWAWQQGFTGYLVNWGTFPEQGKRHFSHRRLACSLRQLFPRHDSSATVTAGLDALLHGEEGLMRRQWMRSDGVPLKIISGLIDANGTESNAVKAFIRASPHAANLAPSYGKGILAKHAKISNWKSSTVRAVGHEWAITKGNPGEPPGIIFDTNYWKTHFHRALALPAGSQGASYLPKDNPANLRMFAEHCRAEKPVEVMSGGRIVYEFGEPMPGCDNHFGDCAVGARVAASRAGIASIANQPIAAKKRRKVSYL